MKLFEGKTPAERNKIIAAIALGTMALLSLVYTFGGSFIGGRKTTVTVSASPTPTASPRKTTGNNSLPSDTEANFIYTTTPVVYEPGSFYAPDAGRNIFAFYEPPPPTPYSPTPTPPKPVILVTPPPPPPPPQYIGLFTPQSVYAGSNTFRLEINGNEFTPDSLIYWNGTQLPTTFVNPQKLVADVPSNFISSAGGAQIMVRTADGRLYSNQVSLTVQAPPVPQFQYIGMIARQRFNNDTAYFQEPGKPNPLPARLNDVIGGRFRLMSISANETVFEDVNLKFKHRLALYRPQSGQSTPGQSVLEAPGGRTNRGNNSLNPNPNPNFNNPNQTNVPYTIQPGEIPGIPSNIPIYVPPPTPAPTPQR